MPAGSMLEGRGAQFCDFPAATGASRSYFRPKTSMMVFVGEPHSRACAWYQPLAFKKQDGHARYSFKVVDRRGAAIDRQVRGGGAPHVVEPITLSIQTAR